VITSKISSRTHIANKILIASRIPMANRVVTHTIMVKKPTALHTILSKLLIKLLKIKRRVLNWALKDCNQVDNTNPTTIANMLINHKPNSNLKKTKEEISKLMNQITRHLDFKNKIRRAEILELFPNRVANISNLKLAMKKSKS